MLAVSARLRARSPQSFHLDISLTEGDNPGSSVAASILPRMPRATLASFQSVCRESIFATVL